MEGEAALANGLSDEAIQIFRKASPPEPHHYTLWPYSHLNIHFISRDGLARAFYAAGDVDKAIAEYKRLITFDPESNERFLINPKYHYRLGKLYEEKGWQGLAVQEYKKFLNIWKDADEDILELIDVKARLKRFI